MKTLSILSRSPPLAQNNILHNRNWMDLHFHWSMLPEIFTEQLPVEAVKEAKMSL